MNEFGRILFLDQFTVKVQCCCSEDVPIQMNNTSKKVNYIHFIRREYDEGKLGNLEQLKRNDSYVVEGSKKMGSSNMQILGNNLSS